MPLTCVEACMAFQHVMTIVLVSLLSLPSKLLWKLLVSLTAPCFRPGLDRSDELNQCWEPFRRETTAVTRAQALRFVARSYWVVPAPCDRRCCSVGQPVHRFVANYDKRRLITCCMYVF